MKKTFLAGFMAFCVCAMSLSTVSCGKLEDGINELNQKVDALEERLDALEERLTNEVANLNSLISAVEAKVAVVGVEKKDGIVTLTLANNTKVEVAVPDANANNTNLITTVTENGKSYWAVVGADGKATSLGIEVGHLAVKLSFKVNPETKELLVSYDGKEFEGTGVLVKDPDEYDHIISAFEEGEDYVSFTIGETTYQLAKYVEDNASLVLGRADFFLRYEGVKKVELVAEGIEEYYVMAKPDGWKATFEETTLVVTAPTKAAVTIGAAELTGEILVHATTTEGKCKVAKIEVKAGPGVTLAIDKDGNYTIENSYTGETVSMWGDVSFGFTDVVFGLATPEDFMADPAKYIQTYNSTWSAPNYMDPIFPSIYNIADKGIYVEKEYETDIIKGNIAEAYEAMTFSEPELGSSFVVWVAPADADGKAIVEDAVYKQYIYNTFSVEVTSVSHSDATLALEIGGADSYLIGYVAESMYNNEDVQATFEEYMKSAMGGPWTAFVKYSAAEALGVQLTTVPAELKLSEIYGESLAYGENYKVWIMPMFSHLSKLDEAQSYPEYDYYVYDYSAYDFEKNFLPYVFDVKTNDIVAGGAHAATLALESADYSSINVSVTPSEGTESVYYAWYSVDEYAEFATDEDIMAALLSDCYNPLSAEDIVSKTYINPGETWVLATFSVGTDGKYGEIITGTYSTADIPYNDNITVELVSLVEEGNNFVATVNVVGGAKVMGFNITASDSNYASYIANVCKHGAKSTYYGYQIANVTDGQAVLTFAKSSYKKNYYIAAYNVTDGKVSAVSSKVLTLDTVVAQ